MLAARRNAPSFVVRGSFHLHLVQPRFHLLGVEVLADVVGVGDHGTELDDAEGDAVLADARLQVQRIPLDVNRDYRGQHHARHEAHGKRSCARHHVEQALCLQICSMIFRARMLFAKQCGITDGVQLVERGLFRRACGKRLLELQCKLANARMLRSVSFR